VAHHQHCDDEQVTSQRAEHGPIPASQRKHLKEALSVVPPARPAIFLTFAEDEQVVVTWSRLHRRSKSVPAGVVHAAEPGESTALCGTPLSTLLEFGRSRHPFERFAEDDRCLVCDEAAGRPQA
jgi:hypothetical protein